MSSSSLKASASSARVSALSGHFHLGAGVSLRKAAALGNTSSLKLGLQVKGMFSAFVI